MSVIRCRCLYCHILTFSVILSIMLSAAATLASAEETILNFHSDIAVHEDASLTVTETIKVRAEGDKIKHGIYREFPARYKGNWEMRYVVGFEVLKVLKNGSREPYHITSEDNGKRIYIGKENTPIPPGEYTYTIAYRTTRQIGFFKDHDELYWNVTGNGWEFPIESASCSVSLPGEAGSRITETDAYTGPQGSKGKNFEKSSGPSGAVIFSTTKQLPSKEGLTIVVSWPKGFVKEPDLSEKRRYFLSDNRGMILGVAGLCVILIYYLLAWFRAGKDPESGTTVIRYTPPGNMTTAVMRYIMEMGYDERVFASALVDAAVKGHIKIVEDDGVYSVKRQQGQVPLPPEEDRIANMLLEQDSEVVLEQTNHRRIRAAIQGLKNYLSVTCEKIYFVRNVRYFVAGLLLTISTLIASGLRESIDRGRLPIFLFMCVWLSGWSFAVFMLAKQVISRWKAALREGILSGAGALFITLFALPFFAGEVAGIAVMGYATSVATIFFLVIAVSLNYLFHHLLKAPTRAGRNILDQIEGFKVFLEATEKDRMNMMNPPERTPELFEKYLPYALALGVEQRWAEQFSDVLSSAAAGGAGYSPAWYAGTSLAAVSAGDFANSLSSAFAGSISSASTAPGSSSGGGGGGSSGGGGGGGGGGGW